VRLNTDYEGRFDVGWVRLLLRMMRSLTDFVIMAVMDYLFIRQFQTRVLRFLGDIDHDSLQYQNFQILMSPIKVK
jgi:hypothetical protein